MTNIWLYFHTMIVHFWQQELPLLSRSLIQNCSNSKSQSEKNQNLQFLIAQKKNLTSNDINSLKEKAKAAGATVKITGFNVVTAHIWRCKALSCDSKEGPERLSTVLYSVDIRPRVKPPLPGSYTGNAVLTAYATAKCKELEEGQFSKLVVMVAERAARMTDEYARSAIDWAEIYKGFPHGEFFISSWWRLGYAEMEYPWGKPKYSCPVVHHRKDIILLFPDIDAINKINAVNVFVALPFKEMEKFQSLFHKLLEAN